MFRVFTSVIGFLIFMLVAPVAQADSARVAIIIDDIGYRKTDALSLQLPGEITFAVLPQTPFGKSIATEAHASNRDVLIHVPMESESGKLLGPGALTSDMDESEVRHALTLALEELPFAKGINNHMGSKLTSQYSPMVWTMRFLQDKNLLFVDSLTTQKSKARAIAKSLNVPSLSRRVFLDNQLTPEYIEGQFLQMMRLAKIHKNIVAIAHPHPETIKALHLLIPKLQENKIDLVNVSRLLQSNDNEMTNQYTDD